MNGHDIHHVSRKDISVLGDLEASLLAQWKSVLHEVSDEEGEHRAEDQRLTAVLGMVIGHTRRLCARFIKEATEALGMDLHRNEKSHATRLELATIETWMKTHRPPATSTQVV